MEDFVKQLTASIQKKEPEIKGELYAKRLEILYSTVVEELRGQEALYDTQEILTQIMSFEESQSYLIKLQQEGYGKISVSSVSKEYSAVAFGLAVERLKGKNYLGLSKLLMTVYEQFLEVVNDKIEDKMLISETLLDFVFSSGNSQVMSFRLKKHWDAVQ